MALQDGFKVLGLNLIASGSGYDAGGEGDDLVLRMRAPGSHSIGVGDVLQELIVVRIQEVRLLKFQLHRQVKIILQVLGILQDMDELPLVNFVLYQYMVQLQIVQQQVKGQSYFQ